VRASALIKAWNAFNPEMALVPWAGFESTLQPQKKFAQVNRSVVGLAWGAGKSTGIKGEKMDKLAAWFFVLMLGLVGQQAIAHTAPTNEDMFEDCKVYQESQKNDSKGGKAALQSMYCLGWATGAFQMFNVQSRCDMSRTTINGTIDQYVALIRREGLLDQPATITLSLYMEGCYCGKSSAVFSCR
jgi:hypothetical protein